MKRSRFLWIVLSLALFGILQTGCQPKQVPSPSKTQSEEPVQASSEEQTPISGGELTEIHGTFIDGTSFEPSEYVGKVVILDFWATWCGPCRHEIAETLIPLYAQYHAVGLEIVGISCDQKAQTVQAFAPKNGITWKQMLEETATASDGTTLSERYGVQYIPFMVLIGRDGQIVSMNQRGAALVKAVEQEISRGE